VGPRTSLDGQKISSPTGFDPGPSSPQSVAILTELPGPRAGLVGQKILSPPRFNPGPSSPQQVAIPTELPSPHNLYIYIYIYIYFPVLLFLNWKVEGYFSWCSTYSTMTSRCFKKCNSLAATALWQTIMLCQCHKLQENTHKEAKNYSRTV